MQYTFVEPPLPSFSRFRNIYAGQGSISCLRALEYEKLFTVPIHGRVLDVGGGEFARYRTRLPKGIVYESVNIDPHIKPTYVVGIDEPFPVPDDTYDTCLCMNTLEHVYDARFLVREMLRVLKPGGVVYITVPFIFRVHGHPDDFFRGTASWWRETLSQEGYASAAVEPLVWGRLTTADSIRGSTGLLPGVRRTMAHVADILYAKVACASETKRYSGKRGRRICDVALGYFIAGHKGLPVARQGD